MNTFYLTPQQTEEVVCKDSEALIEKFLSENVDFFEVNFWGLYQCKIHTEDDIMFLAEACEELFTERKEIKHYVFLDDGAVVIEANSTDEINVQVTIKLTPTLNIKDLHIETIRMSIKDYMLSWKYLAYQISEFINKP
ncbi:hypothetical protein AAG747_05655 [Rapidithrix thailandica]|uniref:Uncharacterized protein n=1 Tax=Rapidithrix thailandica TaxID=413964 RepID=A0AAW9S2T2_9BACT